MHIMGEEEVSPFAPKQPSALPLIRKDEGQGGRGSSLP